IQKASLTLTSGSILYMTIIRFFWKIFDSLLLRRSRASFASSDASAEAFYVELDRQLNQVHHRQWQHAAGLWRATEDCPSAFRIQTRESQSVRAVSRITVE